MTMDLFRADCKRASPTSLQLCMNLVTAGVDSNYSAYSASGLDLYIELGTKLKAVAAPAALASREPYASRLDHLNLAFEKSRKLSSTRIQSQPHDHQQWRLQAEQSACHTAEELEENLQSVREPFKTPNQYHHHDDDASQDVQQDEEVRDSTAVTNRSNGGDFETEGYRETCSGIKPFLACPSNILSQIECFDMADVSAACHLLELSSYSGSVDSSERDQSSELFDLDRGHEDSPGHYSDLYKAAPEYEELTMTQLVDKLQAARPGVQPTSWPWVAGTEFHNMGNDASTFRKRRVRANLIKHCHQDVGQIYFDDWDFEVEVLERPPSKRRNRRVDIIYKRSIQM